MQLEHLFQMKATVGAPVEIGPMPNGTRRIFAVTGGTFEGERLRGTVLPPAASGCSTREKASDRSTSG